MIIFSFHIFLVKRLDIKNRTNLDGFPKRNMSTPMVYGPWKSYTDPFEQQIPMWPIKGNIQDKIGMGAHTKAKGYTLFTGALGGSSILKWMSVPAVRHGTSVRERKCLNQYQGWLEDTILCVICQYGSIYLKNLHASRSHSIHIYLMSHQFTPIFHKSHNLKKSKIVLDTYLG